MFVYGDISTDARVQRAASALQDAYEIILVSTNKGKIVSSEGYKNILVGGGRSGILNFFFCIFETIKIIKRERPAIFYGHDYYSSLIIWYLFQRNFCKKIVYDAHELYIPEQGKRFKIRSRFFYFFEKWIIRKVDLVICASDERAQLMVDHYNLKREPLVVRNISQLSINIEDNSLCSVYKLDDFFSKPGTTVVYAGVVTKSRRIDELVHAVSKLASTCKLLIIGKGDFLDELKILASKNDNLVYAFTGAIPYKKLGFLLSKCDIGFIYYPVNTLNNIYCASNKVYEYASVGLPMISNENPTIKKIFDSEKIGISTNDFVNGIRTIANNITDYREQCEIYTKKNPWFDEAKKLLCALMQFR